MKLPSDAAMLLSFVNTKLRDVYDSLDALCEDCEADRGELEEKLRALGYEYDPARNAFRCSAFLGRTGAGLPERRTNGRCGQRGRIVEKSRGIGGLSTSEMLNCG